jgi:hypothetical protein
MKKSEMFVELQVELAKVNAKLDKVMEMLLTKVYVNPVHSGKDLFRNASTGCLVCGKYDCTAQNKGLPCPSLAPYALTTGNFVDAGFVQVWRESINENQDSEE